MTWPFSLFCLGSSTADKHILLDFPRNGLGWISRIVHKFLIGLDTFKALGHCARNQFVTRLSKIKLFSSVCKFFKINLLSSPLSKLFHRLLPNPFLKQVMAPELAHLSMIMMRSNWWHRLRWKKEKLILIDLHLDLFSLHRLCTLRKTKYNVQPRYLHTDRANCVAGPGGEGQSIKDTDFKWWTSA